MDASRIQPNENKLPSSSCLSSVVSSTKSSLFNWNTEILLSDHEKKFIIDGIMESYRIDGRKLTDYREFKLDVNVIPSASGSCRYFNDDVDIYVSIKCDVQNLTPNDDPDQGIIQIEIDYSPSTHFDIHEKGSLETTQYLVKLIDRLCFNEFALDKKNLCILKGHLAWKIYIYVTVLNGHGLLLNPITIAIRAALMNTRLPIVTTDSSIDEKTGCDMINFKVDPRPEVGELFPVNNIPVCVTLGQIHSCFVWDLNPEEQACSMLELATAVSKDGNILGIHKRGEATLSASSLQLAMKDSINIGKDLHNKIEQFQFDSLSL